MARSLSSDDDGGQDDADGVPNPADELDEDEALELLAMPADLWQTAQDITGRAIPKQKLIRLWDRHHVHGTAETRAAAVLNSLLENTDETDQNNQRKEANTAIMTVHADAPRAFTSAVPSRKRVISVRDDSDGDNIDNRPKTARRLNNASTNYPLRTAAALTKAGPSRSVRQSSIISIDSDDDTDPPDTRIPAFRPVVFMNNKCPSSSTRHDIVTMDSSPSSSSSEEPGHVRGRSTPPTSVEPEDRKTRLLAQVLVMVPNVEISHAQGLVETHAGQVNCIEHVVEALFSKPYPRSKPVTISGKGKDRMSPANELKLESDIWLNKATRKEPRPSYCMQA